MRRKSLTMPNGKRKRECLLILCQKYIWNKEGARFTALLPFLTEEKRTKRLVEALPQTPIVQLGGVYTRLRGVAVLAELAQATRINWKAIYTPLKHSNAFYRITMQCYRIAGQGRAEIECDWNSCARRRKADGICNRPAHTVERNVRSFFLSFSFRKEKDRISPFQRE